MAEHGKQNPQLKTEVLELVDGIRRRPAMYLGGTDAIGLHQMVFELVGNVVTEFWEGTASNLEVTVHADGSVSVCDNGVGIPPDPKDGQGRSPLEVALTNITYGEGPRPNYPLGLHFIGMPVVNALSDRLRAEVRVDGSAWAMEYARGAKVREFHYVGVTSVSGTSITFKPDPQVFADVTVSFDTIVDRLRVCAFTAPGLCVVAVDERTGEREEFCYERGAVDFLEWMTLIRPRLHAPVTISHSEADVRLDVAFAYTDDCESNVRTFVNCVESTDGGTHLLGFTAGLLDAIRIAGEWQGVDPNQLQLERRDLYQSLSLVVSLWLKKPMYESPTRTRLGNPEMVNFVRSVVRVQLIENFRTDPVLAALILSSKQNPAT